MIKKFLVFFLFVFLLPKPVFATVSCTTQYGGSQNCVTTGQIIINKKVLNPGNGQYFDNLALSDHQFKVGDDVFFSLDIKNSGDATINNVSYTDTLPPNMSWAGNDPLSTSIGSLSPGQDVTKIIHAKINGGASGCLTNTGFTTSSDGGSDQDTAQFCLAGPPLPKTTPPTGPEDLWLLLPISGIGFYLKRFNLRGVKS